MGQLPRGPQLGEADPPSRRVSTFALLSAAAIAIGVFVILQRTDPPAEGARSVSASGALAVIALTAEGQPVRGLEGTLRINHESDAVVGRLLENGHLTFAHAARGGATLELRAAGFARLRNQVRLSAGQRVLTVVLAPGAQLIVKVTDDRGIPLPGVAIDVWQSSAESGGGTLDTWAAATDLSGEAILDDLPLTPLSVAADSPGHEPTTLIEIEPTLGEPVAVVLQRTAKIEGRLVRKDDRQPAAGTIVIAGSGVWPPRRLEVGTNGRFVIEGLPGGVYELHASAPGRAADPLEGITVDPGEIAEATLLLAPAVRMRARVIDAVSGKPIAGAQVLVDESSLAFTAATVASDATGEVSIEGLRARPYRLSIQADGYIPLTSVEQVPGDVVVTHALVAAAEIRGQIVDSEGRPVAGASLEIIGDAADGIPLSITQGSLAFRARLLTGSTAGPLPLMRSDNLGVTVGAIPRIPIASAFARHPSDDASDRASTQVALLGFTSDTFGQFTLTAVPPGSLELVVVQAGWALARSARIAVKPGARISGIRITLERGAQVSGTVADSRGFPMAGVRVELECSNDPTPRSALTDDTGRYTLGGALGRCTVTATPHDLPPARGALIAATGDTLELDLVIAAEAVRFQCSVVDSGGFPVVGAAVRVEGENPAQPTSAAGLSRADGTIEIDGLGAPPYRVEISHPDFAPIVAADIMEIEGGRFTLIGGVVLRGTALAAADRSPLPGVRVELRTSADSTPRVTRAGPSGLFEIRNVTAGNYTIILRHPQTLSSPHGVVVSERDVTRGVLDVGELMLAPAGSASGTVTDRLGVPVPGARVSSGSAQAATDSEGQFTLAGLAPGLLEIGATHSSAGHTTKSARTRVFEGQESPGVRLQLDGRYVPSLETEAPPTTDTDSQVLAPGNARLGVAIEVGTVRSAVGVVYVVPGSLAERAGLRAGDFIRTVDGEPVVIAGQARSLLRGDLDTIAAIDITRGPKRMRVQARRERFVLPSQR